jgi:L-alanine-DL-glutamate epimerase-like enolase superfamily enzyme
MDIAGGLLQNPIRIVDGRVTPSSAPGIGLEWNADAVAKHRARA